MNLSSDQRRLVCYGPGDDGNGICAIGATQSGKTFSGLAGFFSYTTALPTSERHLFLGKKLKVLESECLPQVEEMAAGWNMLYHYDRGRHILRFGDQTYYLYGGMTRVAKRLYRVFRFIRFSLTRLLWFRSRFLIWR